MIEPLKFVLVALLVTQGQTLKCYNCHELKSKAGEIIESTCTDKSVMSCKDGVSDACQTLRVTMSDEVGTEGNVTMYSCGTLEHETNSAKFCREFGAFVEVWNVSKCSVKACKTDLYRVGQDEDEKEEGEGVELDFSGTGMVMNLNEIYGYWKF